MRIATLIAILGALLFLPRPTAAKGAPSARSYYEASVRAMSAVKAPKAITFREAVTTTNISLYVSNDARGNLVFGLGLGGINGTDFWDVVGYPLDGESNISLEKQHFVSKTPSPLFDPTWNGAYRWLRYGILGVQPPTRASASRALPSKHRSTSNVIATVMAIGSSFYDVTDAGASACPGSNDAGHALHLIARDDPTMHPLTDVIVDVKTHRFCSMRFALRGRSGFFGATGYIELHFAKLDGYWLVHDGVVDVEERFLGIGLKQGTISFKIDDLRT